jgi:hypothetical protein
MRTISFPSRFPCMNNAANAQHPPNIIDVPLKMRAPEKSPFCRVTKAPEMGVPVRVLMLTS